MAKQFKLGPVTITFGKPTATTMPEGSPAQQLATLQAQTVVAAIMSAIRRSAAVSLFITLVVQVVSFEDQHNYLRDIGMRWIAQWLIPVVPDAATIACITVLSLPAVKLSGRIAAGIVVIFSAGSSAYLNVQASPTVQVAIVYFLVVMFIPAMEFVKAMTAQPNIKVLRLIEHGYAEAAVAPLPKPEAAVVPVRRGRRPRVPAAQRASAVSDAEAALSLGTIHSVRALRAAVPGLTPGQASELMRTYKAQGRPVDVVATVEALSGDAPVSPAMVSGR